MKPFKGTFAVAVIFFLLAHFLGGSLAFGLQTHQSPLYISYEKRILLTYLLAGAGQSEEVQLRLAQRMENTINQLIKAPVQEVKIKSFAEFLTNYKGPWPNSYSVESDLQLLESKPMRGFQRFRAEDASGRDNHELQKQIEGFLYNQNRRLIESTGTSRNPIALLIPVAEKILTTDDSSLKRKMVLSGFKQVTDIASRQFAMLETVGDQIAASGKLAKLKPQLRLFLETVLQKYFVKLGMESKKQIISRFLGENLTADPSKRFELMLMSSGPQLQKLLQIIANDKGISEDLQVILKKLESKVFPIPASIAQKYIEAERDRYKWVTYSLNPLGTGTMAQVHKGVMQTPKGNQDVVIRFLKPEIADRVAEDARILGEIAAEMDADQRFREAKLPKLTPIVQDTNRGVIEELDLPATIKRQKIGLEVYNRNILLNAGNYKTYLHVRVPGVIEGGVGSNLIVQDLVSGRKFEDEMHTYQDLIPKLGKAIGEEMAKMWAEEAFFKSGFFHSDLHQGNYLVSVTDEAVTVHVLDFGMGGVLSKEKQQSLLLAGMGLKLQRADLIAKALYGISVVQINEISEMELRAKVSVKLNRIQQGFERPMELSDLMAWSMDEGMRFTYEIVSMNRGMMNIDQALKKVGSSYSITDLAETLVPRFGHQMILNLYQKNQITKKDLVRLGWEAFSTSAKKRHTLKCEKVHSL